MAGHTTQLPASTSPSLVLGHPTPAESQHIWGQTSALWKDALTVPQYMEEYAYMLTVPLAREGGITQWILVDSEVDDDPNESAGRRTVLASCETFRKRALISNADTPEECVVHGIASVFCAPELRGQGYASRLLKELGRILPSWQTTSKSRCVGSVLYSDINPEFYARLGWMPFPSLQLEFQPQDVICEARPLHAEDLEALCRRDEDVLRASLRNPSAPSGETTRLAIIPDYDHVLWHHSKEEFGAKKLFGGSKKPGVKGAIAGPAGNRVWVIWTHRFYRHPDSDELSANTLYILRLVTESSSPEPKDVKAVLHAAQSEAFQWGLGKVKLWSPTRGLEEMIQAVGVKFEKREREKDSIPCLNWFGEGATDEVDWVLNEKYAWC
ncbi:uncharacterized protein DSM5745_07289 [Aspergillus mulundensis]|uniref:LYC1 C-terminal domain-containing protein n=1 Tax=Aspergillus mulundensis TaxID=1810919 RepID=A0A3D8RKP8_9EURO|nr:Uncharacterized protein DSM5745_07289 [Aspergillus mulundensis]RDW74627.1 Uncharacterized protein DSM5745_07289 [Aspergillus mulundensis]